ncbi:MAG TPA: hypothetical protein DFR83_20870 [Deltaproteobacteria bacterium]|nr:hypothetical protein [Deltaproteobacteria bacterium]
MSHNHTHSHGHGHEQQHAGLAHTHDHHHGPAGDWDPSTVQWYIERYGDWPSPRLLAGALDIEPGQTVVDVGCGTGSLLSLLRKQHAGVRLVGVDGSGEMIRAAREQTADASLEFHAADAAALPLEDACADQVVLLNALHHFPQPAAAMAEAMRILKPGGTVWVGTDEDVYDMAGWSNGRVRDELSGVGFRRVRQTSRHDGDVVLNVLSGVRRA